MIFSFFKSMDLTKIIKITGYILSGTGTMLIGISSKRENDKMLEKLVEEKIAK